MTFYQGLAVTLLRVWATTIIAWAAYSAVSWLFIFDRLTGDAWAVSNLVNSAMYLVFGLLAWIAAPSVGTRLGRMSDAAPSALAIDPALLVAIGSFVVGAYLLIHFLSEGVAEAATMFVTTIQASDGDRSRGRVVYDWEGLAKSWLAAGLSLLLMLRARGMGRLFMWLREAGLPKADPTEN